MFEPRHLTDGRVCCSHEHALCDSCKAHHTRQMRSNAEGDDDYTPPDPYAAGLAKLRGSPLPPPPAPPKANDDYTPPDPYAAALAKMRQEGR
ncbi:MAG: hypothetical protein ABI665_13985 [Vicinamibacterales bacterium]